MVLHSPDSTMTNLSERSHCNNIMTDTTMYMHTVNVVEKEE